MDAYSVQFRKVVGFGKLTCTLMYMNLYIKNDCDGKYEDDMMSLIVEILQTYVVHIDVMRRTDLVRFITLLWLLHRLMHYGVVTVLRI